MSYNKDSITHLDPLEHIRHRPGMYIGSIGQEGVHHLVQEIIDNIIDEILAGYGSCVEVSILQSQDADEVTIRDYGRGIPVGYRKDLGMDVLTAVFTKTSTGGKFNTDIYKTSSGLNGTGLKAVTALSSFLRVDVFTGERNYYQEFKQGVVQCKVKSKKSTEPQGTKITFIPDSIIFDNPTISLEFLVEKFHFIASLIPGTRLILKTNSDSPDLDICLDSKLSYIHDKMVPHQLQSNTIFENIFDSKELSINLSYHRGTSLSSIHSFMNTVNTVDNGSHVDSILKIIIDSLKRVTGRIFTKHQILSGLNLVVSVYHEEPVYKGQSKSKVSDAKVSKMVYDALYTDLFKTISLNTEFQEYIVDLVTSQEQLVEDLSIKQAVKTIKSKSKENKLPIKLAAAYNCTPEKRELFIVEGNCFSGETEITDIDFNKKTFKSLSSQDLKNNPVYTFSVSPEGTIEVSQIINCWKATQTSNYAIVTIDNGEKIVCTLDHQWMLISGDYCLAQDLTKGYSLMSLHPPLPNTICYNQKIKKIKLDPKVVLSIEIIRNGPTLDFYDLEVDSVWHNFSLGVGVFVHNSAAGSTKVASNNEFQEILPLKGKIINAFKANYSSLLSSQEVMDIFLAIGGMEDSGTSLRCHNVFILSDPDQDAAHIDSLLLSLFIVAFPSFVKNHNLYVVKAPLYTGVHGDERVYGHTIKMVKSKFAKKGITEFDVYRNKGLGEMSPDEMKEVISPKTRELTKVILTENSIIESEKIMGQHTEVRKLILEEIEDVDPLLESV